MNFYIGKSISTLDISADNAEFSDELLEFIYEKGKELSFATDKLSNINPYTDTVIPLSDLPQIIEICKYFLTQGALQSSRNPNEWSQMISGLIKVAQKAMLRGSGLISIGD